MVGLAMAQCGLKTHEIESLTHLPSQPSSYVILDMCSSFVDLIDRLKVDTVFPRTNETADFRRV